MQLVLFSYSNDWYLKDVMWVCKKLLRSALFQTGFVDPLSLSFFALVLFPDVWFG